MDLCRNDIIHSILWICGLWLLEYACHSSHMLTGSYLLWLGGFVTSCSLLWHSNTIMLAIFENIGQLEVNIADEDNNLSQSRNRVGLHSSYMGNSSCWFPCTCHSGTFNIPSIRAPFCIQESWGSSLSVFHFLIVLYIPPVFVFLLSWLCVLIWFASMPGAKIFDWCCRNGSMLCNRIGEFIYKKSFGILLMNVGISG